MKKFNEWTKKQKIILGVVVAGVVVGGASSVKAYENHQYKQQIITTKKELNSEFASLKDLASAVDLLRDKENPNFLSSKVTLSNIETIEKQLDKFKSEHQTTTLVQMKDLNTKVVNKLDEVEKSTNVTKFQSTVQEEVNALFVSDKDVAIKGTTVKTDLSIIDDLTIAQIEKVVNDTKNKDMLVLLPKSTDEKLDWEKAVMSVTDSATNQVKQIDEVTKKVNSLFKENKPIETTEAKIISEIEKEINTIKNEKAKKSLSDKLKQVSEAVTKKTKEVAETKAKEEQAVATKNAENSATNGSVETNNNTQSQATDTNNYTDNGSSNTYTPTTGGGDYSSSNNGGSTGGGYTPPANNNGGGSYTPPANNGGGNSNGGSWSGTGNQTGGGNIDFGQGGDEGWNNWTGGDFDGSGIPDW